MQVETTEAWRRGFPDAHVGILVVEGVTQRPQSAALDLQLAALEGELRRRYSGFDRGRLTELPVVGAYYAHYKPFGQTYHVLRQLESVALKGRPLASPGGTLVSAMFAAELSTLLLTAGHDADVVDGPLVVDASRAGDRFVSISGQERELKNGDMLMRDRLGIISAVLNGPDLRTRLTESTRRALFVTYAPAGIARDDVERHLATIAEYVSYADTGATVTQLEIL
jgi:DNA/RNA-binding domain of Phe-tRNA-synthetase-like protein